MPVGHCQPAVIDCPITSTVNASGANGAASVAAFGGGVAKGAVGVVELLQAATPIATPRATIA